MLSHTDLVVPAFGFPLPVQAVEAGESTPAKRAQAANRAGLDTTDDRNALEKATTEQLLGRLADLKTSLQQRLLAADGSLTDFKRFSLQNLLADVDRLTAQAQADLADIAKRDYTAASKIGQDHSENAVKALNLTIHAGLPGLDAPLVQAAFGNTVDLLTLPMQQFATDVKISVRRVALAGDGRHEELLRLRDKISGAGFAAAQYKAERIIRTELGRVFNGAAFERMTSLAKDFPFLRKGWRATKDKRTRLGHVQAGETYARGKGIPMAQPFKLQVYDQRPGKPITLIGVASLQYPVDPNVQPAGRVGAGATIMCRCNGFVDVDLAAFAAFTKARVSVIVPAAVPGPAPVPPGPGPVPAPMPKKPTARKPRVVKPKLPKPVFSRPVWEPEPAAPASTVRTTPGQPLGPAVSRAIRVQQGYSAARIREALAALDRVHGDGVLPSIPAESLPGKSGTHGFYEATLSRPRPGSRSIATMRPLRIGINTVGTDSQPMMVAWHELGHFLDHAGFGNKDGLLYGTDIGWVDKAGHLNTDAKASAMKTLVSTMKASRAVQTLARWRTSQIEGSPNYGDKTAPVNLHDGHLEYLLSTKEVFARAYAQYIAVESQHADGLAELANIVKAGTTGPVASTAYFNWRPKGKPPAPGTWDYPSQWTDDDFRPIRAAMTSLFQAMGWRK